MILHPQLVDTSDQEMYGLIYQPSSYPQHVLEVITILTTVGRLHKKVLSSGIKINYTTRIYYNNISLFWYTSFEPLSVITISLSIGIIWILCTPLLEPISDFIYTSVYITIFDFWFSLRVMVKLQRLNFIILGYTRAGNKFTSGSLCGI